MTDRELHKYLFRLYLGLLETAAKEDDADCLELEITLIAVKRTMNHIAEESNDDLPILENDVMDDVRRERREQIQAAGEAMRERDRDATEERTQRFLNDDGSIKP